MAWDWSRHVAKLKADPGATMHYLFDGKAPKEGDVVRLPALAATLKTIAAKGARAFYEGEIADDMAATVAARGSFLTAEDFARHRGDAVTPISSNYRGLDLVEIPPNGQGLTALVLLNILENFDLAALDPFGPERFHLVLEAARLAYAVRDTHIADAEPHARAGGRSARQGLCQEARRQDRPEAARQAAADADARQRYDLSHAWSTATAWRCRSSTRSIRISAPASAPRRPASC